MIKRIFLASLVILTIFCACGFVLTHNFGTAKAEAPVYEVTGLGVANLKAKNPNQIYVNATYSDNLRKDWNINYEGTGYLNGVAKTVSFRLVPEAANAWFDGIGASKEGDVFKVGGKFARNDSADYTLNLEETEFIYAGNNVWEMPKPKADEKPAENLFLDANGVDLWLSGQTTDIYNNSALGNFWGFLPGSDVNVKVSFTSGNLADGNTVKINFAKRYKASYFSTLNMKMLISNAAGVDITAYATADASFHNPAGKLSTTAATEAGIMEIDVSKLADAEGYVDSFVIRRTGSDGQVFVDYVDMVMDKKDDTVYESPIVLPIDGKSVIMSPGSYGVDVQGVLDDDKKDVVANTENIADGAVIKFSFSTKYKASNFLIVSAYIAATNWTKGNTVTTTMYALSDTGFTTPLGQASHSTESFGRANVSAKASSLAGPDGYISGFYLVKTQTDPDDTPWQFFAASVTLVPEDSLSDSKYLATGYFGEGIANENEHWTEKLQSVNGWADKDGKYEPEITINPDNDAANGYVFKVGFHSWFHTIATNAIIFNRPVSPAEAQAGIIIRIKAHLSPNGATYNTSLGGIRLYSLDSIGAAGQGYMIPAAITQDEFILLYLNGEEAALLANSDGYIYGVQIGAAVQCGEGSTDFYVGNGVAYIAIDYIELRKKVNVTYYNATANGETKTATAGSGFGAETIYLNPTETENKQFFGWVAGKDESALSLDNFYDFSQSLDNDTELYGWWINVSADTEYYGIYKTADGKTVKIYSAGAEIEGYADYEKLILSSDGKLYVKRERGSEILDITDTSTFTKIRSVEITFFAFGKPICVRAITEGDKIEYTFAPDGYEFKKWVDENGAQVSTATAENITLFAVCERTELAASEYAEYLGRYFNRVTGDILDLKAGNAAKITFADGTTKDITYYLLENGGFSYIDGENETPCSFNANRILLSAETEYARLTSYTVTFYADDEEFSTATVDGGDYKAVAPENAPGKKGFEFVGWFTQIDGGVKYNFDGVVYKNTSLYARFKVAETPDEEPGENPTEKSGCAAETSGTAGLLVLAFLPIAFAIRKKKYR